LIPAPQPPQIGLIDAGALGYITPHGDDAAGLGKCDQIVHVDEIGILQERLEQRAAAVVLIFVAHYGLDVGGHSFGRCCDDRLRLCRPRGGRQLLGCERANDI